ncbi:NAD(P)/FAD-dependent oxidoreductase [Dactylosporangium sp. CA-092794]|uniref:NAD(P)/FAD-dependent oxidoreductase n=1 Tax=Dactylosporangium sp. CA-092794 TaxID=3239929 RepID=UPI003D8FEC8F
MVVLGAGHAGVEAAAALRKAGFGGAVTLVGDEDALPYQRPPLSKDYLAGTQDAPLPLRGEGFYAGQDIELRTGQRVTGIDRAARRLVSRAGAPIGYDHLILALGALPRPLPLAEPYPDGVRYLRTVHDSDELRGRLASGIRVVVVGGGFLGLEFASVAAARGAAVTVVESAPALMGRAVSAPVADTFARLHRDAGIEVLTAESVTRIRSAEGRVVAVDTASGRRIPADLVMVSIGATPNTALARAAGLAVGDGILVDAWLRTSDPAISAIGDCARWRVDGGTRRLESVQNATDQARCVAARLAGTVRPYAAVPWFWTDQGVGKLQMVGVPGARDRFVVRGRPESLTFSVFHFDGDRLTWVESVGRPGDHRAARRLLEAGAGLSPDEAADPDTDLKALARSRVVAAR